jgi:hypothetical protein
LKPYRHTLLGAIGGGVAITAALFVGLGPSGAGASIPSVHVPSTTKATATNPLSPLKALPVSISLPITVLGNEIAGMLLPGQNASTGSNVTSQKSPLANVDAPVNACAISAGVLAGAASSCSTTSVGLDQLGALGNVNVPITAQDNAIGLLGKAATALGLTATSPAATSQNGVLNAFAPISICSINVGLIGSTSSACDTTGTNGVTAQKGVIDAAVPVTVCDVIVEIVGNSAASCPTNPDTVNQSGELADAYVPGSVCGVLVELDGNATGSCMPTASFPLVGGLPTNALTQSAPIDAVLPVNACSILVAIDGTATNSCEPSHVAPAQTGSLPVVAPVTVCSVTAALDGKADAVCTGSGNTGVPIGVGGSGSGVSLPVTVCGIEAALGGSASAACPEPVTTLASVTPKSPTATTPAPAKVVPVTLAKTAAPAAKAAAPSGALAFTGAPLVLELLIGLMALIAGLAINLLARRQRGTGIAWKRAGR